MRSPREYLRNLLRWQKVRQGTGYDKLLIPPARNEENQALPPGSLRSFCDEGGRRHEVCTLPRMGVEMSAGLTSFGREPSACNSQELIAAHVPGR